MAQDKIFIFSENADKTILVGTYRLTKEHLSWILGEKPMRKQMFYNVRNNVDLFSNRKGAMRSSISPDYILLYNRDDNANKILFFHCKSVREVDEATMKSMEYPKPHGDYILFELIPVTSFQNVEIRAFIENHNHTKARNQKPFLTTCNEMLEYVVKNEIISSEKYMSDEKEVFKSIDLFAGIGGIRRGFDNAFGKQIKTVYVSEWDIPAQQTYKANYPFDDFEIAGDITVEKEADIPAFDICLAGFPCQAFSMAGKHQGFNDDYKGRCRGTLFLDVARICEYHKPKVIFCENVKGLTIHDKGRTFQVIRETFENLGYKVFYKILNSKDFGVPQQRERIYLVCFRNDIAPDTFQFPEGTKKKVCIRDIMDVAPVPAKYYLSDTYVDTLKRHRARHEAAGHGFGYVIRPLDGIAGTIVCGGMGRETNLIIDNREHSLAPTTHIKGEINKEGIRKMTPREWARLQGYPDTFILPLSDVHLYKQFGNSVTVPVIEAIAKEIKKVLNQIP